MNAAAIQQDKDCPICKLLNPATSRVCDCGYNFEKKAGAEDFVTAQIEGKRKKLSRGLTLVIFCVLRAIVHATPLGPQIQGWGMALIEGIILVFPSIVFASIISANIYAGRIEKAKSAISK